MGANLAGVAVAAIGLTHSDATFETALAAGRTDQQMDDIESLVSAAVLEWVGDAMDDREATGSSTACYGTVFKGMHAIQSDIVERLPTRLAVGSGHATLEAPFIRMRYETALRWAEFSSSGNCPGINEDLSDVVRCRVTREGIAINGALMAWRVVRRHGAMPLEGHDPVDLPGEWPGDLPGDFEVLR